MSVVKRTVEDYQKALANWRQAAGDFNDSAEAYNKSLQTKDGKAVTKMLDSAKAPSGGGAPYMGSTPLQLIGYDYEHPDVHGAPSAQYGLNGQVIYTDYGVDTYAGAVNGKGAAKNTHWSAGRNPVDYKVVSAAQRISPDLEAEGYTKQYTDDSGGFRWVNAEGASPQYAQTADGQFYIPGKVTYNPNMPGKPGEFTQQAPKDPGLTLQQMRSLEQPDADQALAVAAMGDNKGTVAQRYGGFDKDGEEGLVARAMKGFKS